jgi:putative DNA primase/helicase
MKQKTTDLVRGKWRGVLQHFGVDETFLQNKHGPCPLCGGSNRYRWDDKEGSGSYICSQCGAGSGWKLLMDFKGWDFKTAAAEVDRIIGNVEAVQGKPKTDPMNRINMVTSRLRECSDEVRRYLTGRNLKACRGVKSAVLDYYEEDRNLGEFECMVCPIQNVKGELISYHLTHIKDGLKASVNSPKKMLPPSEKMAGSAIRLTAVYPRIGIAEGIETALAVMELYKMPCWAAASAHMLETFLPPEGVESVFIFSDNDSNFTGQKAAYTLANRLAIAGMTVGVFIPNEIGDYADALKPKSVEPYIQEKAA